MDGCWMGLNSRINNIWRYVDGSNTLGSVGFDINGDADNGVAPWDTNLPGSNQCVHISNNSLLWEDKSCNLANSIPLCTKNPPKSCGININRLQVWFKGGINDISNNGYDGINVDGVISRDDNDCSVSGDIDTSFIIPYNINSTSYTIIYVAKYAGNNRQRIITSPDNTNYLAGFWNGNEGVCYQGGWITPNSTNSSDDPIITSSYPGACNSNGISTSNNNAPWTIEQMPDTFNIGINIFNGEESDWKLYELMIFDEILSDYQRTCIHNYLSQEHTIPIPTHSITPINTTKTCPAFVTTHYDKYQQRQCSVYPTNPLFRSASDTLDSPLWRIDNTTLKDCQTLCLTAFDFRERTCVGVEYEDFGEFPDPSAISYCMLKYISVY